MRAKKKYIIAGIIVVIAAVALYAYKEYNRKPADLSNVPPAAKLSATNLVDEFEENEESANKKYLGKTIEVTGMLSESENQQDTLITLSLGKTEDMHKVSCQLDQRHFGEIKKYNKGDEITLKGICTGYLADVVLNRCVVSENK